MKSIKPKEERVPFHFIKVIILYVLTLIYKKK